jgi:beta-1,4-mannosyl-glycoprotein beta-1,4-N-acetylglucosaminyltransferase
MFFDEEMLLDLRLNIMDKYVDKFVITEANYMHNGEPKKLLFNINNFSKFKDKIIYIAIEEFPPDIIKINDYDSLKIKQSKMIDNAKKREMYQINKTYDVIKTAEPNDIIIISDLDEIPNLKKVNFKSINQKLIFFKQEMFYYKLNLLYESFPWFGSKACVKKFFKTPEWLRSIKNKKYPLWRLDTFFSEKKYSDIYYVEDGGWHFTNIKKPKDLEKKLLSFLHHVDYENSGLKLQDLETLMKEKRVMYDHSLDKRMSKWGQGKKLSTVEIDGMPEYIKNNVNKYKLWLDV